jgi:hypothetical protein
MKKSISNPFESTSSKPITIESTSNKKIDAHIVEKLKFEQSKPLQLKKVSDTLQQYLMNKKWLKAYFTNNPLKFPFENSNSLEYSDDFVSKNEKE